MKKQITTVQKNVLGAIAGGVALYFIGKKVGHLNNMAAIVAVTVVGVIVGAHCQAAMAQPKASAADGTPTPY